MSSNEDSRYRGSRSVARLRTIPFPSLNENVAVYLDPWRR